MGEKTILVGCCESPVIEAIRVLLAGRCHVTECSRMDEFVREASTGAFHSVVLCPNSISPPLLLDGGLAGHTVLFTTAIDIVNTLAAAQSAQRLKAELKKYTHPSVVLVDELGYLPIDKTGADLLFQVFSHRYETGSTIVTTNQAYKHWAKVFNNDATLTSAVLDRLLHHAETITIEGKSYRMKDQIEEP